MIFYAILKLVHILFGTIWAGTNFIMVLFIMPSAKKMGPDGGSFMQQLTRTNNFPAVINVSAILTILSGAFIYWKVSGGMEAEWMRSGYGISLSLGILLGIAGYCVGAFIQRPNAMKIAAIGKKISASEGPPPAELLNEMGMHQKRLGKAARITAILIAISVISMPVSRFIIL